MTVQIRRTLFSIPAALGVAGLVSSAACVLSRSGLDTNGADAAVDAPRDVENRLEAASDSSRGDDASDAAEVGLPDTGSCNANSCGGACCGDKCVVRSCAGCASGNQFCAFDPSVPGSNGVCVTDCSQCVVMGTASAISCWSCAGGVPTAVCASDPTACPSDKNAGACGCTHASECPGATQVCMASACLTCGQPNTDGQGCANGGTCSQSTKQCPP
jgi:hypothetical protein